MVKTLPFCVRFSVRFCAVLRLARALHVIRLQTAYIVCACIVYVKSLTCRQNRLLTAYWIRLRLDRI